MDHPPLGHSYFGSPSLESNIAAKFSSAAAKFNCGYNILAAKYFAAALQRKTLPFLLSLYIYIYIYISTQSFWTGTKVIERKHNIQPTRFGACSSTCCQRDGEDVPAPWERSNPHPPVRVQTSCVNKFISYNVCSRGVCAVNNSKLRNCVIVAIECFFATVDRCSIMTGMYRRSMMIYGRLNLR